MIAGRPRSGKTYESVKFHILVAVKAGRKVITNVPLDVEHFVKVFGEKVRELIVVVGFDYTAFDSKQSVLPFSKPADYMDTWRDEDGKGPLYVVDEAHFSIPKTGTHKELLNFYTMHGHYGLDILLMTQHPGQIDRHILNLVEVVYRTIKATAFGSKNKYIKKVQDGHRGAVVNTEIRTYDKEIFPFYKSHTQSKKAVLESSANDIKPIWKHWSFIGAAILLTFGIISFVFFVDNPMAPKSKPSETPSQKSSTDKHQKIEGQGPVKHQAPQVVSNILAKPSHPYSKLKFHISSRSTFGKSSMPTQRVNLAASLDSKVLFEVDLGRLRKVGYYAEDVDECLVLLKFKDIYQEYITCDRPDSFQPRGVDPGQNFAALPLPSTN